MRRETRINFIFLAVFVVFVLPGAIILFRKKLDPTAHRLDQPDPVLNRLPYMAPPPSPPGVKWIVPDRTQAWVETLTAPALPLSSAPPGPQWKPVISDDHRLQVLGIDSRPDTTRLTILLWSGSPEPNDQLFSATIDGSASSARVADVKVSPIPREVRRELVTMGFVRPPQNVMLISVDCQNLRPSTTHRLDLAYTGPPASIHSEVQFKVSPAGTQPNH